MITRRTFQTAAVGAAFTPLARAAKPLNIGVGTFSYHGVSMDVMIDRLRALHVTEIEMSRGEFMLMKPPTVEMCELARTKLEQAGIRCVSYYTATIKNMQDLEYAVRNAHIFGARNVSGDATGAMLGEIDGRFTREKLTFGIHNHWFPAKFAYETVDDVLRALDGLSKTVGATLDTGQMAACGQDPVDAVRRLASRLKVVHLKDVEAAGAEHNVLLGQGIAKVSDVMRELKRVSFSGLVALEYEKEGDVDADMEQQMAYAHARA
jgi:sugar phosphate isomerase/epimerase